ncbi:MAG: molybdopterin-dependent oxidoreductase, partial [Syntrophales bacterium LBB04]|nr:molybdopterin-dependent oxidoreductase [Syntrophales bacterium LBB04]
YTMGITQHVGGTDTVKALANLAMLCGNVGIEGGGVNPLRGQNNVQGACDMGALPDVFSAYQKVADEALREKFPQAGGVSLPAKPGLTLVEMMNAAAAGKIKGMYIMGENPMLSDPDLSHVEAALKKLDFLVVQDIFLTETAQLADVVLPSLSFAEKDGTFTNSERLVQRIRKAVSGPGDAKPDWEIIAELAGRLGYPMHYGGAEAIMEEIRRVTPSYGGITYKRIEKGGIPWPCPLPDHPGTKFLHKDRFTRGLGLFHAIEYRTPAEVTDAEYPLILTTGRVLYHYHTGTMTRIGHGINERCPESLVEINPQDAANLRIESGNYVTVSSRRGKVRAKAKVTERSPLGTIFMNFHFREAAVNLLTNPALDPDAKIPEYKVCAVKVEAG